MRKRKKPNRKLTTLLLSAMMVMSMALPVYAANEGLEVDNSGTKGQTSLTPKEQLQYVEHRTDGKIIVRLSDGKEGTSKKDVELSCLRVAAIERGDYVLDDAYSNLGVDLNDLKNAQDLEGAATKIAEVSGNGTLLKTDTTGAATFSDLEVGVYLLKATNATKYDDVTPFLISIPTWNESKGDMMYEVTVNPKHTPKPDKPKTCKYAPQTNVDSPILWYFGGAVLVVIALVAFNLVYKKKHKR